MEVESFEAGTLLKIIVPPRVNVPVQSTVGFLGNPGEAVPAVTAPAPAAPKKAEPSHDGCRAGCNNSFEPRPRIAQRYSIADAGFLAPQPAPVAPALFRISPRAAALAKHSVIDAARIKGTGPEGRMVERTSNII